MRPVVKELGIPIGGWHDFRHTLVTGLRKKKWAVKVISEIVGHSSTRTTEQIYDHADAEDFRSALGEVASELQVKAAQMELDGTFRTEHAVER